MKNHQFLPPLLNGLLAILLAGTFSVLVLAVRGDLPNLRSKVKDLPVLGALISHRDQIANQAKLATLNYFIPSFDELAISLMPPEEFTFKHLRGYDGYIDYYERVAELFPQLAESQMLLGFFYFQEKNLAAALAAFQKATSLNPRFFWAHYNLGVLYFKNNDFRGAAKAFAAALQTRPDETLKIIATSKIYQQIMTDPHYQYDPVASLTQSYQDGYQLLQLCLQYDRISATVVDRSVAERLQLKIF